jgi:hypothetical protein
MEPINTSMLNDDGSMRMMPGWTQIERQNDMIGRNMPYTRKATKVVVDDQDANLLWSERSKESKQVMLSISELPSTSDAEPLPLLTTDLMREITPPDGSIRRNLNFRPFPVYRFAEGDDSRVATASPVDQGQKQQYALEICYPLFKVEKIERVERHEIKSTSESSAPTKVKRGDDWDYGPWILNDNQAGMWEAAHPHVNLIRFGDGRWSHPDFYEREYVTSLGSRYSDSLIARRNDLGLFEYDGAQYVWKLSLHCQEIQLYEAHMDRKIRRHWQLEEEQKVHGVGKGNAGGKVEGEIT